MKARGRSTTRLEPWRDWSPADSCPLARRRARPIGWWWRSGSWGIETPFAWRHVQAEKPLWDCVYDPLIMRDPKTFEYRPGLATEWKPSNEMRTWTFKLRSGVKFHEGWGELTAEDVKFTVEQNLKPDATRRLGLRSFATTSTGSRRPTS